MTMIFFQDVSSSPSFGIFQSKSPWRKWIKDRVSSMPQERETTVAMARSTKCFFKLPYVRSFIGSPSLVFFLL